VATDWGQVAHDAVVAQDIQVGQVSVSLSAANQGSTALVFPRPFAGVPVVLLVVVSTAGAALGLIAQCNVTSTTGATIRLSTGSGGNTTVSGVPVFWLAYGPRA
jgi:hypothetical protein